LDDTILHAAIVRKVLGMGVSNGIGDLPEHGETDFRRYNETF